MWNHNGEYVGEAVEVDDDFDWWDTIDESDDDCYCRVVTDQETQEQYLAVCDDCKWWDEFAKRMVANATEGVLINGEALTDEHFDEEGFLITT